VKHGCTKKGDWNRIQAAEINCPKTVKGYARTEQIRSVEI
jgi:hypothetical protein